MKKNAKYLVIALILLFGALFVACGSIDSIYFESQPRALYVQGQDLDFKDAVLMSMSGEKSEVIDINGGEVAISGYDKNTLGQQTVTFTYKEKSTSIKVTVIPRVSAEGISDKYFVGDVFDKTKGRLKIADDVGNITTVNMSSDEVTIVDFDSSVAAENKAVTVKYGDITGTFPVQIYDVANVKLSAFPKTTKYESHDSEFNVVGAYFTVTAKDNAYEKFVELTADMVTGFDLSAATPANINTPLKQTVKLNYLSFSFDFEISISYSAVSLMKLRAEELKNVNDPFAATEEQGKIAWDAIVEYFDLAPADKKLVSKEDKEHIVLIAAVYGYEKFKAEAETFKDTFALISQKGVIINDEKEEVEKTLGVFSFVAESYEGTREDVDRILDPDEPLIKYAEILRQIEDEFDHLKVGEKSMEDYVETVFSEDGLALVTKILEFMLKLYDEFKDIPDVWERSELNSYKSAIKRVVVSIRDSDYNPYYSPSYNVIFDLMSKWRTNDDFFEIIFSYYLEYEKDAIIDELWEGAPFPGTLMQLYSSIAHGLYETMNLRVGGDTTEFMYYYKQALEIAANIKKENDPLMMEIYELFNFDQIIDNYFFIGNSVDGFAYIYHVSSLFGNKNFEELMTEYLNILEDFNSGNGLKFSDPEMQQRVTKLVDLYLKFSPAEKYAFISALHCEYRHNTLYAYVFGFSTSEEYNGMGAYSWFGYLLYNTYNSMLTEQGFDVFAKLMVASEMYALRYRAEEHLEKFKDQMALIVAAYDMISAEDRVVLSNFYNEYKALYDELTKPATPDISKYQDKFDALNEAISNFYEVNALLNDKTIEDHGARGYFGYFFSSFVKARAIADELIATNDPNVILALENVLKTFDTDRAVDGGVDTTCSIDYILQEMANIYYTTLYKASITGTNGDGEEYAMNAFYMYYDSGLPEFLVESYDIVWAQYRGVASKLDPSEILEVMKKYRGLSSDAFRVYDALKCGVMYVNAIKDCFKDKLSADAYKILELLLEAESDYSNLSYDDSESVKAQFKTSMDALIKAYNALSDKSELADFEEMYQHYRAIYNQLF